MTEELPEPDVDYFTKYEGHFDTSTGKRTVRKVKGGESTGKKLCPENNMAETNGEFGWGRKDRTSLTTAKTILADAYSKEIAEKYGRKFMEKFVSHELHETGEWSLKARNIPNYLR